MCTVGVLIGIGLSVTACSHPSSSPASSSVPPTTHPVTTVPSTSTPSTPASTLAPAPAPRCLTGQLRIQPGRSGAAAGSIGQAILFTNVDGTTCSLSGYPGVAALDAGGNQVVQARRSLNGMLGGVDVGTAAPDVDLGPGQVASAEIEGGDNPTLPATSCPVYPAFLVTPPDDTHSVRISAGVAGANSPGFQGCGTISVNPVVPGSTGGLP